VPGDITRITASRSMTSSASSGSTASTSQPLNLPAYTFQATTVPLQSTLAGTELGRILVDTAAPTLVATVADLELAAELALASGSVRSVVAIDYDARDDDERAKVEAARKRLDASNGAIQLVTIEELIDFGRWLRRGTICRRTRTASSAWPRSSTRPAAPARRRAH
jgi:hypothetical protein